MQITTIGLGQVGVSVGLALAKYKQDITLVGYDKDLVKQNFAQGLGAYQKTYINRYDALKDADIVLLAVPYQEFKKILPEIKDDLKPTAVVMSFTPNKAQSASLFQSVYAGNNNFIGLTVSYNPEYSRILDPGEVIEKDDLFCHTTIGISVPSGTDETALKYASDLVALLGAKVYYLDLLEADGIERTAHLFPQLVAGLALGATIQHPGWNDSRDTISQPYLNLAAAFGYEKGEDLANLLVDERDRSLAMIDQLISSATTLRGMVSDGDAGSLDKYFSGLLEKKDATLAGRRSGRWEVSKEKEETKKGAAGFLRQLFFGNKKSGGR